MLRTVALFVLMSVAAAASAQDSVQALPVRDDDEPASGMIEPIVQAGHGSSAGYAAFTPDEKYLLSADGYTAILWNVETGLKVKEYPDTWMIRPSPDGKNVLILNRSMERLCCEGRLEDLATGRKILDAPVFEQFEAVYDVRFHPDGRFLATIQGRNMPDKDPEKRTVRLWDMRTGELVREFAETNLSISAVAFPPVEDLLAGGTIEGTLLLWNWKTGERLEKWKGHDVDRYGEIRSLTCHPTEPKLLSQSISSLRLWDMRTKEQLFEKERPDEEVAKFFCGDKNFALLQKIDGDYPPALWNAVANGMLNKLIFSPKSSYAAQIVYKKGLLLYAAPTMRVVRRFGSLPGEEDPTADSVRILAGQNRLLFDEQNGLLMTGDFDGHIQFWDVGRGRHLRGIDGGDSNFGGFVLSNDKSLMASGAQKFGSSNLSSHFINLWDAKTWELTAQIKSVDPVNAIAFSPDDSRIAVQSYAFGKFHLFSLFDPHAPNGEAIKKCLLPQDVNGLRIYLRAFEWLDDRRVYADMMRFELKEDGNVKDIRGVRFFQTRYVWDIGKDTLTQEPEKEMPPGEIMVRLAGGETKNIWQPEDGRLAETSNGFVIHSMEDGSTRLFRKPPGGDIAEEICSLYVFKGGKDWLVITPQGLFDGSPGGRRMVSYRIGNSLNVQPVEAFFQDFYHPGLLAAIWKGERPQPSATLKDQLPPDIKFVAPKESGDTDAETCSFEVVLTDLGGGIREPHVTLNGIGVRIKEQPAVSDRTVRWNFSLPLVEGPNAVVVHSATADGQIAVESPPITLVNRRHRQGTPSLYVLAVGINDYADGTDKDLTCARPDAEALADAFKRRGAGFFGTEKVHVRTLLDSEATADGIRDAMRRIAVDAKPEDVVVLSFAGHGATIGSLYHFLPYDFKFGGDSADNLVRKQGIPNDVLQDWINEIPAMKRVLIYDTCQSGAAIMRSGMEHRKAIESLTKVTGCFAISAASGMELARELPDVGHGALTYSLLAGLGEAKRGFLQHRNVAGSDGMIRVRDWLAFAQDEVPNLTRMSFGTEQRVVSVGDGTNFPLLKK